MHMFIKFIFLCLTFGIFMVGCEAPEFGDKEYTENYLRENNELFLKLEKFCKENKNKDLTTIQIKNCQTAEFRRETLNDIGWKQ